MKIYSSAIQQNLKKITDSGKILIFGQDEGAIEFAISQCVIISTSSPNN
jgi:hypothetical protein